MAEADGQRSESQEGMHVRPHVLVVTNDADLRDFLQEGLLVGGFWVSVIASGVQTLEVFRLRSFDLVLLDADLAGFDAQELIRRLRGGQSGTEGESRTDVPILLIVPQGDGQASASTGADRVLPPPIELETLIPLLHDTVKEWRRRHPDRLWADQAAQLRPRD